MHYRTASGTAFQIVNYTLFTLFCASILVPFLNAIAISLSSYQAVAMGRIGIWPEGWNFGAYYELTHSLQFFRSFMNTAMLTLVNTTLVILLALAAAYALSHKHLIGKRIVFSYLLIPMFFNGGLIPTYLLVNRIGLNDSYLALILPSICSIFYIIVFKNAIDQLPKELQESAEIDGCGEGRMMVRIILPLVLPMAMAFTVFSAVAYWNEWFGVLLYIRDKSMWTLQYQLRDILISSELVDSKTRNLLADRAVKVHPENLKMAALMITILPIVVIYPFVQTYFIHGQFVGAVKG
ncbi:carbohydrate ABC transporter permease [Paenibacillus silvisoli]|uniref:carbohydrate ABC transporter permease n=1 Tax=Paenibacillus silvisoli TaxID=3110539 RepID=UPI0028050BF9|nr:carbohydrate ABC transporter permease [Paenibacillus silvisoli]